MNSNIIDNFQCFSTNTPTPLVGISSCLTGCKVRYDGKGQRDKIICTHVIPHINALFFCPEVAAGLGTPRPPVNLIKTDNKLEALGRDNSTFNVTKKLINVTAFFAEEHPQLCGFIGKSRSPSCGFGTTPIYNQQNEEIRKGSGLFSETLQQIMPHVFIINEIDIANSESATLFIKTCWLINDWRHTNKKEHANFLKFHKPLFITIKNSDFRHALEIISHSKYV